MTTSFHQAALPPGWHLADEAILPGGRALTGTAARVYNLLLETQRHSHRWAVGRHLAPAGWVPTWVLREPWAGGAAGDRRLRDLREAGVAIDSEKFATGDGAPTSASWLWRLASRDPPPALSSVLPLGGGAPSPGRGECVWERGKGGEGPGAAGPLQGLTLHFLSTPTPPAGAIDISPGASSSLAPTFAACEDEAYRQELLQAYHSGRLLAALAGSNTWSLWADPAAAYDPRPVLTAALTKLGATLGP